mmetsp:Transcript_19839/g.47293  ORF Transcript_19839/g.47293 Transcript_19839/m.47293 type:complete len:376 (-) Transcript_19839:111-1238(-)
MDRPRVRVDAPADRRAETLCALAAHHDVLPRQLGRGLGAHRQREQRWAEDAALVDAGHGRGRQLRDGHAQHLADLPLLRGLQPTRGQSRGLRRGAALNDAAGVHGPGRAPPGALRRARRPPLCDRITDRRGPPFVRQGRQGPHPVSAVASRAQVGLRLVRGHRAGRDAGDVLGALHGGARHRPIRHHALCRFHLARHGAVLRHARRLRAPGDGLLVDSDRAPGLSEQRPVDERWRAGGRHRRRGCDAAHGRDLVLPVQAAAAAHAADLRGDPSEEPARLAQGRAPDPARGRQCPVHSLAGGYRPAGPPEAEAQAPEPRLRGARRQEASRRERGPREPGGARAQAAGQQLDPRPRHPRQLPQQPHVRRDARAAQRL